MALDTATLVDLSRLDANQRDAALDLDGPVLITACPGAGKTRVLATRVALLLERSVPQENILCFTFTNRAADEMRSRIESYSGQRLDRMWIGTIHSICARILRQYAPDNLVPAGFTIYDEAESMRLMTRAIREVCPDYIRQPTSRYKNEISRLKSSTDSLDDWCRELEKTVGETYAERFRSVYTTYQSLLRQARALDFDDLTRNAVRLLQDNPVVLRDVSSRFRYICVDEYQDMSDIEGELIQLLSTAYGNLCVVGDPNQAIYGWRGSNHKLILDFPNQYPGAKVHVLNINYRSGRRIVEAANRLMLAGGGYTGSHCQAYLTNPGVVRYTRYKSDKNENEAHDIAAAIGKLLSNDDIALRDIAVLGRTHVLLQPIQHALSRTVLPFVTAKAQDEIDGTEDAVRLLTIHQAKGLEFSVVFIVGLEEGTLPYYRSFSDFALLEEERRLLYVTVTRAVDGLVLTSSKRHSVHKYYPVSRFAGDLLIHSS